jgi:glutathione synthase/RimK-type ligase-like ATP-grasp enzyme
MSTVLLLTAESLPHEDLDTQLLAGALTELGIGSSTVPWTLVTDRTDADLAVIRTTWDYTFRREEFLGFLESLPMPVVNPSAVARWNSHKGYLAELGAAGVPVVPVTMVAQGGRALIPAVGADRIIVKPAISAGARGVGLFASDDPAAAEHLAALIEVGDALVQPFEASVAEGERSLLYLGGTFSHAIRKIPADGDFRVQTRYGGQNLPHRAGPAELAAAQAALDRVDAELLYARVDLVGTIESPLVMELELIEPELFLPMAPGSAELLAAAIAALL